MGSKKKYFWFAVILVVAMVVIPMVFYVDNVGDGLSSISKNWGDFGSYMSGTVSSIIGSVSLAAIAFTVYLQLKEHQERQYFNVRDSYLKIIDDHIEFERELYSFYELRHQGTVKDAHIKSLQLKQDEPLMPELVYEIEREINIFDSQVSLEEVKSNQFTSMQNLNRAKRAILRIVDCNLTRLDEVYNGAMNDYFAQRKAMSEDQ
ncbi:hypothetical protein P3589_22195 [Vibrio parahaemolyticus]|uniref:hypothetical protein n=1 Tax=Vibrio parahaemolyticus TaxID=670 RepID=UPI00041195F9|nr:hypothetical protein [Vibrio parahaemolyticus]EGR1752265.1 hypothetical protein [Vibrio parahaemolyticus]EHH1242172.1 hypothetical protein [Vibrio parahaemolyticus]EIZ0690245.1 hypothetical protein [Vibrio parahaemolyticus]EKA7384261.1 hypothetical protein [Vibrio parahaemolyticus]EME0904238.1 hypothetical protein [Vibrio parahaemolyticus]